MFLVYMLLLELAIVSNASLCVGKFGDIVWRVHTCIISKVKVAVIESREIYLLIQLFKTDMNYCS